MSTPREPREFDDIPGAFVFDGWRSRLGYHLNMFCKPLDIRENREEFRRDQAAYLRKFPMTEEQHQAALNTNYGITILTDKNS